MAKILTTQNAQITTAAVEVKTLTISGKMVTQSVFRQLLNEDLVTHAGDLKGAPWGHVNYHPGSAPCSYADSHLHVVWQKGNELRRCIVDSPTTAPIRPQAGHKWLMAHIVDGWRSEHTFNDTYSRPGELLFDFPSGKAEIVFGPTIKDALWPVGNYTKFAQEKALKALEGQGFEGGDSERLAQVVDEQVRAERIRRQRHEDRWAELSALPHLFIAV